MSLSVNTNNASMVALQNLNDTQSQLSKTQNAISTGKKVSTSADSPASFGIAAQMNNDIAGQSAVNDGLSFASSVNNSANVGANNILSVLQDLRKTITDAGNDNGSQKSLLKLNNSITSSLNQINSIARNSTANGVNMLTAGTQDGLGIETSNMTFVTGLRGDTQTVTGFADSIGKQLNTSGGGSLSDLLGLSKGTAPGGEVSDDKNTLLSVSSGKVSWGSAQATGLSSGVSDATKNLAGLIDVVSKAVDAMTNVTSQLGANQQNIDRLSSYGKVTSDSLTTAVGSLTDADMASESAKQTSLQTKQSLGIKSLSIANSQSQNILQLFQ